MEKSFTIVICVLLVAAMGYFAYESYGTSKNVAAKPANNPTSTPAISASGISSLISKIFGSGGTGSNTTPVNNSITGGVTSMVDNGDGTFNDVLGNVYDGLGNFMWSASGTLTPTA